VTGAAGGMQPVWAFWRTVHCCAQAGSAVSLYTRSCWAEAATASDATIAKRRMTDGWMDGLGGRQTATCDKKTPSANRTQEQRGRHAYEAVTTVRSFVRAQAGRQGEVRSSRYSSRDFAVAADKTMSLRNVP
jgi:hypothetical protein